MIFDISADAIISLSIQADTLQLAKEKWRRICDSIQSSDNIMGKHGDQFYVFVADGEPEIEQAD